MDLPKLYRKRFMPNEIIPLVDDRILYMDEEIVVTKWDVFRPKKLFSHGVSCYFKNRGYKVSKFLNEKDEIVYYYCDIISTSYEEKENAYTFTDLLADVIVQTDGFVKVVDLAELADAEEEGLITVEEMKLALRKLEDLLTLIYDGKFPELLAFLDKRGTEA